MPPVRRGLRHPSAPRTLAVVLAAAAMALVLLPHGALAAVSDVEQVNVTAPGTFTGSATMDALSVVYNVDFPPSDEMLKMTASGAILPPPPFRQLLLLAVGLCKAWLLTLLQPPPPPPPSH